MTRSRPTRTTKARTPAGTVVCGRCPLGLPMSHTLRALFAKTPEDTVLCTIAAAASDRFRSPDSPCRCPGLRWKVIRRVARHLKRGH